MNTENLEPDRSALLAFWIKERRNILAEKEAGLARPWTEDPILNNYRFTNVRREDDRVTKWIANHWRNPYVYHENLLPAMVLARMLNNPDTLQEIGFPEQWNKDALIAHIKARRDSGAKILNAAYLITTCGVRMDKVDYIVGVADSVYQHSRQYLPGEETLEVYFNYLTQFKGLGSFLSAQVIADIKNTPYHPLQKAPDWWSWAAPGPGSLRGLRNVLARQDLSERHFLLHATTLYHKVEEEHFKDEGGLQICMQDFQNCLCEFSKYWKAYVGEGTPKQRY
jgi:hypothetical protein